MSDRIGCIFGLFLLGLGAFFMFAEIARAVTWIKWAFQ